MNAVELLKQRIELLSKELELSAARHNALLGSVNEARLLLQQLEEVPAEVECGAAE